MDNSILSIYLIISILIIITTAWLGVKSVKGKTKVGISLAGTLIAASLVVLFYVMCILAKSPTSFSIFSSIYFIFVDIMVLFLLAYTVYFTQEKMTKLKYMAIRLSHVIGMVDMVMLIINIFNNFAISYEEVNDSLLGYKYVMDYGYYFHLAFNYVILICVFYMFISRMLRLPWEYKKPYIIVISGILVVVLINALWLFTPSTRVWSDLDYSVWGYSIAGYFLYWTSFKYIPVNMPNNFRTQIVESIEQGVVLFDLNGTLILSNERARHMLSEYFMDKKTSLDDFSKFCGINLDDYDNLNEFSTQIVLGDSGETKPIRCDCHIMENKKHKVLGRLFVFSDMILGVDLLTSFHTLESFENIASDRKELFSKKITVVIFDIIGLKIINYNQGRTAGDEKIRQLSAAIKKVFPRETFFVRGQDANLMAICRNFDEKRARECVSEVKKNFDGACQYAISTMTDNQSIDQAIIGAERTLRARKLMDKQSQHSEILTSLLVALQECDPDTEKHVERTQAMGAELGKRIELTEIELSDLSLLCILHDIGKIGIPLEILNKPSKLNDAEWEIMKSHVEKGYQITSSNNELSAIADMVRYHHERWDGKGYPDKLRGHEIPKLSRIISIVDAYDAMVHDRIYRQAMDPKDAQAEILRCAGTQFDPYIAQEFVKMLQESKFKDISDEMSAKVQKREHEKELRNQLLIQKLEAVPSEVSNIELLSFAKALLGYDGKIVKMDDLFAEITGYTQADIEEGSLYLSTLIYDEDFKNYIDKVSSRVKRGELAYFSYNLRRKDGSRRNVTCITKLVYDTASHTQMGEFVILNTK